MIEEHTWIGYSAVAASTEAHGTSISELANSDECKPNSWECGRFANFPQEVIIRLDNRVQLSYIVIASKPERNIPEVEIHVGDGLYGSFVDAEYHLAGKCENITHQLKQIPIRGIGSFLKFIFTKKPRPTPNNPNGQIGLGTIKIWARPLNYASDINEINPIKTHSDDVDKILMSMGVPLELLLWSKEDQNSYRYAPIDEDSRETILELDQRRNQAYEEEDYGALKQLTKDIKRVFDIGTQILQLKRELSVAIAKEDFDAALELRDRIRELEKDRDSIDAMYETKRYQRMILMGKASDAHMAMVNKLLEEERLRAELLRRQREEEAERHRLYLEELERKRRLDEMRMNKKEVPSPPPAKKPQKREQITVEEEPYGYNEGDIDLEPYLRPRLNEAGGNVRVADIEILKRADVRKILRVVGVRLWSALYSDNWRHREAAIRAFLEFLESPLLPKYQQDTRALFRAAIDTAMIASDDRVMPIYLYGLKVLITAMSSPIGDTKVTAKMINDGMRIFIPILLGKVGELNYRARDISMHTLIELFRHPNIKHGPLIDYIMSITNPTEGPVEKQQWRIILARLEILLHVIQELGVKNDEWSWKDVFHKLIVPLLGHANSDVRQTCVEVIIALYQKVGMELRLEVDGLGRNIKPQLAQIIYKKMLEIDQTQGDKPNMDVIEETHEWAEQTPPGTGKGKISWNKLKDMITNLAEEEAQKKKKKEGN